MLKRHTKLIQLFMSNKNYYLSGDEIASYLNVSNRTVRNDIQYINSEIINSLITSVKGKGYKINYNRYSEETLETLIQTFLTQENEILLKLGYELLMYKKPITITKKEANDYVNRIQAWCRSFGIEVDIKKKKGITIIGNEMDVRNAILHLNQLSAKNKTVEALIFNEMPQAHIKTIFHIIKATLKQHDIQTSDLRIEQLLIHLIIIIKRERASETSWVVNEEAQEIAEQC